MSVEALLLARLRASRPQDAQDIQELSSYRKLHIDWNAFGNLGVNETEIASLKKLALFRR